MSNELVRIGSLWVNTKRDGTQYLGGTLGNARCMILKNQHKRNDRDPDYTILVANKQKEDNDSGPSQRSQEPQQPQPQPPADDDLPF